MKKDKHLILGILACVIIGAIGTYMMWQKPKIREEVFTFAYGETIPKNSSTYLRYGTFHEDIMFDEELFSMQDLGEYQVEVSYENKTYVLNLQIVDKEAPKITFTTDREVSLYRHAGVLNVDSLFQIEDMSETTYELTPSAEALKDGIQNICVNAKDEYENEQEACKEVELTILDYAKSSTVNSVQAQSVSEIIGKIIKEKKLNESNFAFFYYSFDDNEEYIFNPDTMFNAASTIKVPLNMVYEDSKNAKELSNQTTYTLLASDVEAGDGETTTKYKVKDAIPLAFLQEQCITQSDNTATNILIRSLGSFATYKTKIAKYSDVSMPSSFYSTNNVNATYMMDVMKYLYTHKTEYATLIDYMKDAAKGQYLQESSKVFDIAQKYGSFGDYLHSIGIVYTPKPYIVGIYTNQYADAYNLIVDINESLIEYQLYK